MSFKQCGATNDHFIRMRVQLQLEILGEQQAAAKPKQCRFIKNNGYDWGGSKHLPHCRRMTIITLQNSFFAEIVASHAVRVPVFHLGFVYFSKKARGGMRPAIHYRPLFAYGTTAKFVLYPSEAEMSRVYCAAEDSIKWTTFSPE